MQTAGEYVRDTPTIKMNPVDFVGERLAVIGSDLKNLTSEKFDPFNNNIFDTFYLGSKFAGKENKYKEVKNKALGSAIESAGKALQAPSDALIKMCPDTYGVSPEQKGIGSAMTDMGLVADEAWEKEQKSNAWLQSPDPSKDPLGYWGHVAASGGLQVAGQVMLTKGAMGDEWLLPQALKEAGYRTAIVGKWHLGHADRKYWPRQRGFDYQYGPLLGEIDYFTHAAHGTRDWFRNNRPVKEQGYVTRLLGTDAVRLIDSHDPRIPLFLYLAFTAPHAPYQPPPEDLDRHKHIADLNRRAYAAMITAMDGQNGRVLAALERRTMRENTLIVFHSDNGGSRQRLRHV